MFERVPAIGFMLGIVGVLSGFVAFYISLDALPKIKRHQFSLYDSLLSPGRKNSWLENQRYHPRDIGFQLRLYKAIYAGLANSSISPIAHRVFVYAVRLFLASWCLALLSFFLFVWMFVQIYG